MTIPTLTAETAGVQPPAETTTEDRVPDWALRISSAERAAAEYLTPAERSLLSAVVVLVRARHDRTALNNPKGFARRLIHRALAALDGEARS